MAGKATLIKYAVLPGLLPRIFDLFKNGFSYTAYLLAFIYANVRLLEPNHPYLHTANIGKYGIRHVLGEASSNLVFSRQNIDQIIIYFVLLGGITLLFMQLILLLFALLASTPAMAALNITDALAMFKNSPLGPEQDIAFILMDRTFGIVDIFESCVSTGVECTDLEGNPVLDTTGTYPYPFHLALHDMLEFYSSGIFVIGVFIIIYFVITIVLETSQSGIPFGRRFNKAWAPVRFILFFALLIPLNVGERNEGLNAAQLLTFWTAKFGSNFATNAWLNFNSDTSTASLTSNYLTQQKSMVAEPNAPVPEVYGLLQFMDVAHTCRQGYHLAYDDSKPAGHDNPDKIDAYVVRSDLPNAIRSGTGALFTILTGPSPNAQLLALTDFQSALEFSAYGNITIRFGHLAEEDPDSPGNLAPGYQQYEYMKGNVMPFCGEITLPISSTDEPGAYEIQQEYYNIVQSMWTDGTIQSYAKCSVQRRTSYGQTDGAGPNCGQVRNKSYAEGRVATYANRVKNAVSDGVDTQRNAANNTMGNELLRRGWAGGAIWYNDIASMNGAVTSASLNMPKASELPRVLQQAQQANRAAHSSLTPSGQFSQNLSDITGQGSLLPITSKEQKILPAMKEGFNFWDNYADNASNYVAPTGNAMTDFVNGVFGTQGLYDMRKNSDVHPLAQLTALGKGMLEAVTRNFLYATGLMAGKIVLGNQNEAGTLAGTLSNFLFSMAFITIAIAVILYYVLPFMPFIYFIFAVSGWLKSIFEAIVAMPLWALAHLRIDGEGLPGPGAANGYFLLLEILIRPILILFGLIASISIFAAMVSVLNQVFDLVVTNLAGHNMELENDILNGVGPAGAESQMSYAVNAIDEFFYTCAYAILCYMIGLSCFKLVDLIPNNIMRYLGSTVATFQENAGDPASQLSGNIYRGTQLGVNQVKGLQRGDLALIAGG